MASMMVRGLRKPMDAVKASMGDLTPFSYLTLRDDLISIAANAARESIDNFMTRDEVIVF